MYLKFVVILAVISASEVNCECTSFFECLTGVIKYFVGSDFESTTNMTEIEKYTISVIRNVSSDYIEIKSDDNYHNFDNVVAELTELQNKDDNNETLRIIDSKTVNAANDKTKIFVATFELDESRVKLTVANNSIINNNRSAVNYTEVKNHPNLSINNTKPRINNRTVIEIEIKNNRNIKDEYKNLNDLVKLTIEKPNKTILDNEVADKDLKSDIDYDAFDDSNTDYPIIDYIEWYKDTTNEDVEYATTDAPLLVDLNVLNEEIGKKDKDIYINIENTSNMAINTVENGTKDEEKRKEKIKDVNDETVGDRCHGNGTSDPSRAIFPWVAAIFIKNETDSDQLNYYCDGAVLNSRTILTAARCVIYNNKTVEPVNMIAILGKTSLKALGDNEVVYRIKQIKVHENFTTENGTVANDLALLITEQTIDVSKDVRAACLSDERSVSEAKESVTTSWKLSGDLAIINFNNKKNCSEEAQPNTFCVTYGNDVPLCPNYGGIYATRNPDNMWYLQGVFYGDPTVRDICINKTVSYTDLSHYRDWIESYVQ